MEYVWYCLFYDQIVYFMVHFGVIRYILPIFVCCTEKNLATLRPILNFAPRGEVVSRGEFYPLGEKFSIRPSILLNCVFTPVGERRSEHTPGTNLGQGWSWECSCGLTCCSRASRSCRLTTLFSSRAFSMAALSSGLRTLAGSDGTTESESSLDN
jgi:hypothetical protein